MKHWVQISLPSRSLERESARRYWQERELTLSGFYHSCLKISQNFTSNRSGVWSKWLSFKQADPTSGISRIFNSLIPLKQLHWLSLAVNSKRWPFKLSTYSTLWIKLTINTCKRWAINSKLSSISCSFFELMWITWKNLLLVPS